MPTTHYMKRRHLKENGIKLPWAIGSKVPSSQTCNATEEKALSGGPGSSSTDNQMRIESKLDSDQSKKDPQLHKGSHTKKDINGNGPSALQSRHAKHCMNLHRDSALLDSRCDRQSGSIATKCFPATRQLELPSSSGINVVCKDGCMPSASKTAFANVTCMVKSKEACGTTNISKDPAEPAESSKTYGGVKKNGTEQVQHSNACCRQSLYASYGLEQSRASKASNERLNAKRNKDACPPDLGHNTRQANRSSEGPLASRLTFDPELSRLDALGFKGRERSNHNHSRGEVTSTSCIAEHNSSLLGQSEKYGQQQMKAFLHLEPATNYHTAERIGMLGAPIDMCRKSGGDNDAIDCKGARTVMVAAAANKSKGSSPVTTSCSKAPPKLSLAPDTTVHDTMGANANHSKPGDNCDKKASNTEGVDALVDSKPLLFTYRLEQLKVYKTKHGHLNVNKNQDKALAGYFYSIRRARRHPSQSRTKLTEDMILSLDEIGFDWSIRKLTENKSFDQRLKELQAYKTKHCHLSVSQSEDKSLYKFCVDIQIAYRKHSKGEAHSGVKLDIERIAALDALGFEWAGKKVVKTFEERLDELRSYKAKHGHLSINQSEDKSLYKFCSNARVTYRKHLKGGAHRGGIKLTAQRIEQLNALGFDWVRTDRVFKTFEERVDELRLYKAKHGHLSVSQLEDNSLYTFCARVRVAYKMHSKGEAHKKGGIKLTDQRIEALLTLGFDWVGKNRVFKTFEERLDELISYKAKHDHLFVSIKEDKSLYKFCGNVRMAYRNHSKGEAHKGGMKLTAQRIEQLNALGFDWVANKVAKTFGERVEELKAFKIKHGHLNVQRGTDQNLYDFCVNTRSLYRHPGKRGRAKLDDESIESLNSIGFIWELPGAKTSVPEQGNPLPEIEHQTAEEVNE